MSKLRQLIEEHRRRGELRAKLEREGGPVDRMKTKVTEGPPGRLLDVRDPFDLCDLLTPPYLELEVRVSDDITGFIHTGALANHLTEVAPFAARELITRYDETQPEPEASDA